MAEYTISIKVGKGASPQAGRVVTRASLGPSQAQTLRVARGGGPTDPTGGSFGDDTGGGPTDPTGGAGSGSGRTIVIGPIVLGG